MPRLRQPQEGKEIKDLVGGFPLFFLRRQQRIVTADIWRFMRHLAIQELTSTQRKVAIAYLEQGEEFFQAAENPNTKSRPLLFYYSFLNAVKAVLLIKGVKLPYNVKHGVSDPKINTKKKFRFEGQEIRTDPLSSDHSKIFPEFNHAVGGSSWDKSQHIKLMDLLAQIPGIHRTYIRVVGKKTMFLPIHKITLLRNDSHVWARLVFRKKDKDVDDTLEIIKKRNWFKRLFHAVSSDKDDEYWFETHEITGRRRGIDTALVKLSQKFLKNGTWSILTPNGYRFYFSTLEPRYVLPSLVSIYAVIFYLGSVTRYRPHDYDKILDAQYAWIIQEFLATQPLQFMYALASWIAGVDVVIPYAHLK